MRVYYPGLLSFCRTLEFTIFTLLSTHQGLLKFMILQLIDLRHQKNEL